MARRRQLDFEGVAAPVRIGAAAREILHKTVDDGVADLEMAKAIRIDLIEPDPDQPRKSFDPEALRGLAQSIRVQGVLQPIVVEWLPDREKFRIISGERRWRAARLAAELQEQDTTPGAVRRDLSRIPAIVRNPSAVDRYVQQVYENEQRQDYSDVERAFAYERLKDALGLTWEELATKLGLSKGRIHQIRRTKNRLAPSVQLDITHGHLTGRHGLYLAPLPEAAQESIAEAVKRHQLTHQQTQQVVQQVKGFLEAAGSPSPGEGVPQGEGESSGEGGRTGQAAISPELTEGGAAGGPGASLTEDNVSGAGRPDARSLAEVVERAVAQVTAPRPVVPRARRQDLDRVLALIRQLISMDVRAVESEADRARLMGALDELIGWASALRARWEV